MVSAPLERRSKLRLFLDATILISAVSFPRLPFEILHLGLAGEVGIVLSPLVIESARRHVERLYPGQLPLLEQVLEQLQTPLALLRHVLHWPEDRIEAAIHRSWRDIPT